jgi:hypothetical protein
MAEACAGSDNTVIVMVCNTGQSDLLINFICSAQARGFGDIVKEKVLVFATDKGVLDIANGLGLRVFYDEKVSSSSLLAFLGISCNLSCSAAYIPTIDLPSDL